MKSIMYIFFLFVLSCNSLKRGSQSSYARCGYGTDIPDHPKIKHLLGGEIGTYKNFFYGKFKTQITYQLKEGVVVGFFLYSEETREEIDFEFVGTHGLQTNLPPKHKQERFVALEIPKEGETKTSELEIDWTPDGVRWLVDGVDVRYERIKSNAPKKLLVNLWASANCEWAGILDLNNFQDQSLKISYITYTPYDPVTKTFLTPEMTDFTNVSSSEIDKNWYTSCHAYIEYTAAVFNKKNVNLIPGEGMILSLTKNVDYIKACHP